MATVTIQAQWNDGPHAVKPYTRPTTAAVVPAIESSYTSHGKSYRHLPVGTEVRVGQLVTADERNVYRVGRVNGRGEPVVELVACVPVTPVYPR